MLPWAQSFVSSFDSASTLELYNYYTQASRSVQVAISKSTYYGLLLLVMY